jgi:tetratricopeptide (TPR) repeat protein
MPDRLTTIADARSAALERRFDVAAELATRVLEASPTCLPALRILGWAQLELGDDRAPAAFQACLAIDPEDALAHVGQAIWHQQRQDAAAARAAWTKAWQLDPHNQDIRRALVKLCGELPDSLLVDAAALLRAERFDEADDLLQRAYPEQPEAVVMARLDALWGLSHYRQVSDLAAGVYASQPHGVKAVLYMAALEERAGRTLRSRELLARAEHADPGLVLFGDLVRRIGLQPAVDLHRASRGALIAVR